MMKFTTTCGILSVCLSAPFGLFAGEAPSLAAVPKNTPTLDIPKALPKAAELTAPPAGQRMLGKLSWQTDYAAAYQKARDQRKMLFIFFRDERDPRIADTYERSVLSLPEIQPWLQHVVRVILPIAVMGPSDTKSATPVKLLDHKSFEYMYGRMGIAMIDLMDSKSPHFGQVVSAHPFSKGQHYTLRGTQIVLGLPIGTVTQRALVYAMRLHPEHPASAFATANPVLMEQAHKSSQLMAQYESVGHHDWGTRSAEISATTGFSAMEVAASGYGSGSLIDAALECVAMWQTSPTHWGMITAPARVFGYDMVRGASGNWYGTGIFAN